MENELHKTLMDLVGILNSPILADRLLRGSGVSIDRALFPLLVRISHRGPIGVAELSKLVGRDHTTVSRQIAKLETMKLIQRRNGTQDHRLREAVVTKEGQRAVIALGRARNELLNEVLSEWSSKDRLQLTLLTRRFVDALSQFVSEMS
jgi:DNA-binding MarR family transcriptional regulator